MNGQNEQYKRIFYERPISVQDGLELVSTHAPELLMSMFDGNYFAQLFQGGVQCIQNTGLPSDTVSMDLILDDSVMVYRRFSLRKYSRNDGDPDVAHDTVQLSVYNAQNNKHNPELCHLFFSWEGMTGQPLNSLYVHVVDWGVAYHADPPLYGVTPGVSTGDRKPFDINAEVSWLRGSGLFVASFTGWPNREHRGEILVPVSVSNPQIPQ